MTTQDRDITQAVEPDSGLEDHFIAAAVRVLASAPGMTSLAACSSTRLAENGRPPTPACTSTTAKATAMSFPGTRLVGEYADTLLVAARWPYKRIQRATGLSISRIGQIAPARAGARSHRGAHSQTYLRALANPRVVSPCSRQTRASPTADRAVSSGFQRQASVSANAALAAEYRSTMRKTAHQSQESFARERRRDHPATVFETAAFNRSATPPGRPPQGYRLRHEQPVESIQVAGRPAGRCTLRTHAPALSSKPHRSAFAPTQAARAGAVPPRGGRAGL
jgi:hypothetical protein